MQASMPQVTSVYLCQLRSKPECSGDNMAQTCLLYTFMERLIPAANELSRVSRLDSIYFIHLNVYRTEKS